MSRRHSQGFTLLEVMVAVAILGLALTAIFSSEAGAIRMATRSGKMGMGALLARCKMGEIEEQIAEEGLPAIFDSGSDGCCEDAEIEGFSCDWEINLVILPDTMFAPEEGEEGEGPDLGEPTPGADPGSAINVPLGAAMTDPQDVLSGDVGLGGMAATAIGFVYPILKPAFESQIRRATVTVKWKEGDAEKSFDVTQYLVANQGVAPELEEVDPEDPNASAGGTPPATGAPGQAQPASPFGGLFQ